MLTSYSRGFSTITIEQTLQQTHLDTKADESNFQKNARAELIQALDNVIQVNKSLGLSNVNVSSSNNNNKRANNLDGENRKKRIASWKKSINRALSKNDIPLATELFYAPPVMVNDNIDISLLGTYNNFISRLRPQKLGLMIDVYHRFEELYSNSQEISDGELPKGITTKRQTLLNKLIKAIGAAPPKTVSPQKFLHTVNDLSNTIQCITEPALQHELYPALMANLIKSRMIRYGKDNLYLKHIEKEVWDSALHSLQMMDKCFMMENDKVMNLYSDVLSISSYRKQEYLPFHYLLKVLVHKGTYVQRARSNLSSYDIHNIPRCTVLMNDEDMHKLIHSSSLRNFLTCTDAVLTPEVVLNVVQNEYPFFNVQSARDILKCLLLLQQNKQESTADYILDMGTLEHLCCVSSRKGNSPAMKILLNYIQEVQNAGNPRYQPTEGIYESMAQAFVSSSRKEDHLVFALLAEMESNGLTPSYIFLRGLSQAMRTRSTVGRLDLAGHMLRRGHNPNGFNNDSEEVGSRATTSALNTIISGYADLGLVDRAYQAYTTFDELGCEPDANTFAFLLESVVMQLTTALPPRPDSKGNEWALSQEDIADAMVDEARNRGFHTNKFLIHSYVQVLCATGGSLKKAKNFIYERISEAEENEERPSIGVHTFSTLALNCAQSGDFDSVDEIRDMCISSGYTQGFSVHVTERIDRIRETQSIIS